MLTEEDLIKELNLVVTHCGSCHEDEEAGYDSMGTIMYNQEEIRVCCGFLEAYNLYLTGEPK